MRSDPRVLRELAGVLESVGSGVPSTLSVQATAACISHALRALAVLASATVPLSAGEAAMAEDDALLDGPLPAVVLRLSCFFPPPPELTPALLVEVLHAVGQLLQGRMLREQQQQVLQPYRPGRPERDSDGLARATVHAAGGAGAAAAAATTATAGNTRPTPALADMCIKAFQGASAVLAGFASGHPYSQATQQPARAQQQLDHLHVQINALRNCSQVLAYVTAHSPRLWARLAPVMTDRTKLALALVRLLRKLDHSVTSRSELELQAGDVEKAEAAEGRLEVAHSRAQLAGMTLRLLATLVHPRLSGRRAEADMAMLEPPPFSAPFDDNDEYDADPSQWDGELFASGRDRLLVERARQAEHLYGLCIAVRHSAADALVEHRSVFDLLLECFRQHRPSWIVRALSSRDALCVVLHACTASGDLALRVAGSAGAIERLLATVRADSPEVAALAMLVLAVLSRRRLLDVAATKACSDVGIEALRAAGAAGGEIMSGSRGRLTAAASLLTTALNRLAIEYRVLEQDAARGDKAADARRDELYSVTTALLEASLERAVLAGLHRLIEACATPDLDAGVGEVSATRSAAVGGGDRSGEINSSINDGADDSSEQETGQGGADQQRSAAQHPMESLGYVVAEFSRQDLAGSLMLSLLKLARRAGGEDARRATADALLDAGAYKQLMLKVVPCFPRPEDRRRARALSASSTASAVSGPASLMPPPPSEPLRASRGSLTPAGLIAQVQLMQELVLAEPSKNTGIVLGNDAALCWAVDLLHATHLQRLAAFPSQLGGGRGGLSLLVQSLFELFSLLFAGELSSSAQRQAQQVLYTRRFVKKAVRLLAYVRAARVANDAALVDAVLRFQAVLVGESDHLCRQFVDNGGLTQIKELGFLLVARGSPDDHEAAGKAPAANPPPPLPPPPPPPLQQRQQLDQEQLYQQQQHQQPHQPRAGPPPAVAVAAHEAKVGIIVSALLILTRLAGRADAYHRAIVDADFAVELRDLLNHGSARVRSETCHLLGKLCKDSSLFYGVLIQQLPPGPRPRPTAWQPPSVVAPRAGVRRHQPPSPQHQHQQLAKGSSRRRHDNTSRSQSRRKGHLSPWSSSSSLEEGSDGSEQGSSDGESDAPSLADADVDSGRHDLLYHLIARCADEDMETRKNACFAIGNSAYHSDLLYADLGPAIPLLNALLGDEERKTRANAAGAIGNCVRNSGILCFDLVRIGAHERLVRLIESDPALQARRMALFSLGNLVVYKAGRDAIVRCLRPSFQGWLDKIGGQSSDAMIKTYANRVSSKLALPALRA